MLRIRRLIKIIFIIIVTIFLMVFIAAGALLLMIYYDYGTEKLFSCFEFGLNTYAWAKYYLNPYPPNEWVYRERIEDIWKYLENEKVQKIAFCGYEPETSPDKWWTWGEITEPDRINRTFQLIRKGKIDGIITVLCFERMKIITDKHKFIIPVTWDVKEVYSQRWRSHELRIQLRKWGFPDFSEHKYELPEKELVVAILLYPCSQSPPLVLFGDRKQAEEIIFNPKIKEDPNGLKGMADLYKIALLRKFGFRFKKKGTEYVLESSELKPEKLFEGHDWLEKIMDAYEIAFKEAQERERYFPMQLDDAVARIVFITHDRDYWKEIGIDANAVYDDYIRSVQLKTYFDELGITKELLKTK